MGKKGKGVKKDEKPKKEPAKPVTASIKAVLEAPLAAAKPKSIPITPRTTSSKKSDRGLATRIGCVEGFRWDSSEKAPALPAMPTQLSAATRDYRALYVPIRRSGEGSKSTKYAQLHRMSYGTGCQWRDYLEWRALGDRTLAQEMMNSRTLKDGLSAPVTIAGMYLTMVTEQDNVGGYKERDILGTFNNQTPLHVVVVGATATNEEKILKETNYWDELGLLLGGRQVHLYLTGVEMSANYTKDSTNGGEEGLDMRVECWRGTAADFFLQPGRWDVFEAEETIVVALNSGIGPAAQQLKMAVTKDIESNDVIWSWLPSLYFLASTDLPVMFTCTSVDGMKHLLGVVQRVVGMYDVIAAVGGKTPFHSSVSIEGGVEDSAVLRANSLFAIVRGQRPNAPRISTLPSLPAADRRKAFRSALCVQPDHTEKHPSMKNPSMNKRASSVNSRLAPLKRFGKYYSPKAAKEATEANEATEATEAKADTEGCLADARRKGAETAIEKGDDATDGAGAVAKETRASSGEAGGSEDLLRVAMKHTFDVHNTSEGTDNLTVTMEDVFLTDVATARVGVRRKSFALYYHDCQHLREAVYEAELPLEVDHTTVKVSFLQSKAQVRFTARLLDIM